MAEEQHGEERSRSYLYVFIALAIFTALEVGVSYLDDLPEALQLGALVGLAVTKIALVVLWFMHLRYDRRVFAVPFVLGLLLVVPLVLIVAISLDDEAETNVGVETDTPTNAEVADTGSMPDNAAGDEGAEGTESGDTSDGAQDSNASEDITSTLEITQSVSGLELSTQTVGAGDVQIRVTNESQETQQLSIIRPDTSLDWMRPWHGAAMENRPFDMIQSGVEVPADETMDLTVRMDPGRYVLMSGLPLHTIGNHYAVVQVTGDATAAEEGPDSGEETVLSGEQLVDDRCTECHERERVDNVDKTPEEWADTVDQMIAYGAELNDEERQVVIDYLAETH